MSRTKDRIKLENYAMPTVGGATIVESGSNSDGEWTRFADGTQVVITPELPYPNISSAAGAVYNSPPMLATIPASFITPPKVSYASDTGSSNVWSGTRTITNEIQTTMYFYQTFPTERFYRAACIGRWK